LSLVREELRPSNSPSGCGLDAFGERDRDRLLAGNGAVKGGVGLGAQPPLEFHDGAGELASQVGHAAKCITQLDTVKPLQSYSLEGDTAPAWVMDIWGHRTQFRKRVDEYQARTGEKHLEIAERFGTTLATFRGWLYNKTKRPSLDTLQKASAIFGCSVTEFIDDPGQEIAGQSTQDLTDKRRFLAGLMFEGITADELSDEDAQYLWEDFCAARSRLVAMKARHGGAS